MVLLVSVKYVSPVLTQKLFMVLLSINAKHDAKINNESAYMIKKVIYGIGCL